MLPEVEPVPLPDVEPEVLMPPFCRPRPEPLLLPRLPDVLLPEVELPELFMVPDVELPEVEPEVVEPEVEPLVLPAEPGVVCACAVLASKPKLSKIAAVRSGIKMCFFMRKGKKYTY